MVESEQERFELYFDFGMPDPVQPVDGIADPMAAALLIKAMSAKEALEIEEPISPRLHFNLPRIRDIFHSWWPDRFSRIDIRTSPRLESSSPPKPLAATFFSGGVDSFYSLLKQQRQSETTGIPVAHLIFMRGVEIRLEKSSGLEATEKRVKAIAESVGITPIFGETNLRTSFRLHWEKYLFGSALAATGLCLSPAVGYVGIAASNNYNDFEYMIRRGSTPLVDEMYSTENVQIFHNGAEVTRAQKLRHLMDWNRELVLENLRVCTRNAGGDSNCGGCPKCVRTAIPLYAMGLWDEAATFPSKDTGHWVEAVTKERHASYIKENLEFARECGGNDWLIKLLNGEMERRRALRASRRGKLYAARSVASMLKRRAIQLIKGN